MTLMHSLIDHDLIRRDGMSDPWGAAMGAAGAICDVLYVSGERHRIPSAMGYSPALLGNINADTFTPEPGYEDDHEFGDQHMLLMALDPAAHPGEFVDDMPALTIDDLDYAARVLSRYLDLVKLAGKDND